MCTKLVACLCVFVPSLRCLTDCTRTLPKSCESRPLEANQPFAIVFDRGASLSDSESYDVLRPRNRRQELRGIGIGVLKAFKAYFKLQSSGNGCKDYEIAQTD